MKITSMTILVPKDLHSQFKIVAAIKEVTMTDIIIKHIKKVIRENKDEKQNKKWNDDFLKPEIWQPYSIGNGC